jgi:hypothetical protein
VRGNLLKPNGLLKGNSILLLIHITVFMTAFQRHPPLNGIFGRLVQGNTRSIWSRD